MSIDKKFIEKFINVTSKAAIASFNFVGKKDKKAADKVAVDSMRKELNKIDMQGKYQCDCSCILNKYKLLPISMILRPYVYTS